MKWSEEKVLPCICKHEKYWHQTSHGGCDVPVPRNGKTVFCSCEQFHCDNLTYIEKVAKQKGII
jgi:hypothetical protein